ncbi:MAG: hypothetical protein JWM32_820 [Verrucomicrobia bacterium]|nr:hypothetical protein [Verrucomicrobiota bacterium]
MNNDADLLRRFSEEGSQAAFAEIVHRHVDLVYSAALRRTGGDSHRAADVAQQVFITLARDARKLAGHAVLVAWLHTATRNAALNLMISEQRRQAREREALALEPTPVPAGTSPDWDQVRPVLDAAIDELPEPDRAAVVLRFLQHRPYAEIGNTLHVSEDAARMRTDRALEKLRASLAHRGITSTAGALGAAVFGQPLLGAPAGFAANVVTRSLAVSGAAVSSGLFTSIMTTKLITTAALSAVVAFGAGAYIVHHHDASLPPAVVESPEQAMLIASLRQNNQQLAGEVAALNADLTRLNSAAAELTAKRTDKPPHSLNLGYAPLYEQQTAMLNNLRQIDAARKQYKLDKGHAAASIQDLVGINGYIRAVHTVNGEDYLGLSMVEGEPLTVVTPDGTSVTFDPSGEKTTKPEIPATVVRLQELERKVKGPSQKAYMAYLAAHNGTPPGRNDGNALVPYFATPQEGADFVEYVEAERAQRAEASKSTGK